MRLTDRSALVTGAASGIGRDIAKLFACEGAKVAIADLNKEAADATAEEIVCEGGIALGVAMDVSDERQVGDAVDAIVRAFGGVDILVSNAGIQIVHPIEELSYAQWKKMLAIHLDGAFLTTRACLPHMYRSGRGASVIYMGSVHSKEASLLKAPYVTAKHGLIGLCRLVAKEGARHGVRANVICPGFVRTPLVEKQILEQAQALGIGDAKSAFGHTDAFNHLAHWAYEHFAAALVPLAVGHRVVHGRLAFSEPTLIDAAVLTKLEQLVPLVLLHQPHNLEAIRAVMRVWSDLPQVACFDTAFHRGRAEVTERFGLPDELFRRGARRWGVHGLSYEYIAGGLRRQVPALSRGRVIVAHLGSGASLCAMQGGRSVDTTMSFSALDGLPMGTRCGSLDPGVILFLLRDGWTVERIEDLLYRRSGLLGISGISNDVLALLASNSPHAAEAIQFFVYRVIREIGSLTAALGGLDALVFTAGIGENSPQIRQQICQGLAWLGVRIDPDANQRGKGCISPAGGSPSVWVIPTDEEAVIASHTLAAVRAIQAGDGRRPSLAQHQAQ